MVSYRFKIQHKKKTYKCERQVFGKVRLRQSIFVEGCGNKLDDDEYGPNFHPVNMMEELAKILAHEIIEEFFQRN